MSRTFRNIIRAKCKRNRKINRFDLCPSACPGCSKHFGVERKLQNSKARAQQKSAIEKHKDLPVSKHTYEWFD